VGSRRLFPAFPCPLALALALALLFSSSDALRCRESEEADVDAPLRDLERRWRASGAADDAERYRLALIRAGLLLPDEPIDRTLFIRGDAPAILAPDFIDVARACLVELGHPLGRSRRTVQVVRITSKVTGRRKDAGPGRVPARERTMRRTRVTDGRVTVSIEGEVLRIDGLPGGTTLRTLDPVTYEIHGPVPLARSVERAWLAATAQLPELRKARRAEARRRAAARRERAPAGAAKRPRAKAKTRPKR
jgi:hypothetical protein